MDLWEQLLPYPLLRGHDQFTAKFEIFNWICSNSFGLCSPGSQLHKCISRVLNYLTAAKELSSSAVATTGTASVTLLEPMVPVPPVHLGILAKKRKRVVSHTVSSQQEAYGDTPAPTQMVSNVKYVDQVTSPVASCKLQTLSDFKSVAMFDFWSDIATNSDAFNTHLESDHKAKEGFPNGKWPCSEEPSCDKVYYDKAKVWRHIRQKHRKIHSNQCSAPLAMMRSMEFLNILL